MLSRAQTRASAEAHTFKRQKSPPWYAQLVMTGLAGIQDHSVQTANQFCVKSISEWLHDALQTK
jgi:hypothetical protein